MGKVCSKCGCSDNIDDANYCIRCGSTLNYKKTPVYDPDSQMFVLKVEPVNYRIVEANYLNVLEDIRDKSSSVLNYIDEIIDGSHSCSGIEVARRIMCILRQQSFIVSNPTI